MVVRAPADRTLTHTYTGTASACCNHYTSRRTASTLFQPQSTIFGRICPNGESLSLAVLCEGHSTSLVETPWSPRCRRSRSSPAYRNRWHVRKLIRDVSTIRKLLTGIFAMILAALKPVHLFQADPPPTPGPLPWH